MFINLPHFAYAFDIVTNHFNGLWFFFSVEWFMYKYYLNA